jgi:hypothetical protein
LAAQQPLPPRQVKSDAELIQLEKAFEQALLVYDAAQRNFNGCEMRFFAKRPSMPKVLARTGSALGQLLPEERPHWTAADLKRFLRRTLDHDVRRKARAMLRIARAYDAKIQHLQVVTGLAAAEAAHGAAIDALNDLSRSMTETPAHTFVGIAVKARVVKIWGLVDWWSTDELDPPERLAAQVLDAVIAMAADHSQS